GPAVKALRLLDAPGREQAPCQAAEAVRLERHLSRPLRQGNGAVDAQGLPVTPFGLCEAAVGSLDFRLAFEHRGHQNRSHPGIAVRREVGPDARPDRRGLMISALGLGETLRLTLDASQLAVRGGQPPQMIRVGQAIRPHLLQDSDEFIKPPGQVLWTYLAP